MSATPSKEGPANEPTDKSRDQSRVICPMPWLGIGISGTSLLRTCCASDERAYIRDDQGNPIKVTDISSVSDFYNNRFMRETRKAMLAGEAPDFCATCLEPESRGAGSARQAYLRMYGDKLERLRTVTAPDGSLAPEIGYVDFALGNLCNFKCRMCLPEASYQLAKDWRAIGATFNEEHVKMGMAARKVDDRFLSLVRGLLESKPDIQFTSGEPLLSKHHYAILETAVSTGVAEGMNLTYFTNLSVLPEKVLKLWSRFREVSVFVSIEGHGRLNEYIRYGSSWKTLGKNLESLMNAKTANPRLKLRINTVFQTYNVLNLTDLFEHFLPLKEHIPPIPNFNYVGHPAFLNPAVLPAKLKNLAAERIEFFLDKHRTTLANYSHAIMPLRAQVKAMLECDRSSEFPAFLHFTKGLDRIRKQSLAELVPEFGEYQTETNSLAPDPTRDDLTSAERPRHAYPGLQLREP